MEQIIFSLGLLGMALMVLVNTMIINRKMTGLIDAIRSFRCMPVESVVDSPVVADGIDDARNQAYFRGESMGAFAKVVERAIKVYFNRNYPMQGFAWVMNHSIKDLFEFSYHKDSMILSQLHGKGKQSLGGSDLVRDIYSFSETGVIPPAKGLKDILNFFGVDEAHFITMCVDAGVEKEYAGMLELSSGAYTFKE